MDINNQTQIQIINEMILLFEKHNVSRIDAIGLLEFMKYNLLTGDL